MASLNKVMLIGNLTREPELRVTPKGTSICQFGLAANRQYKDESGSQRDDTTFVDVEAWGKQAELVNKYLSKGSPCFIEGRLRFDQWDDKATGQKRSRLRVVLENVQFLGAPGGGQSSNQDSSDRGQETPRYTPPSRGPARPQAPAPMNDDDDVPF